MIPRLPPICWLHIRTVTAVEIALADNLPAAVAAALGRPD